MRTKTIKLYKFEELSKEAQEKAIEEYGRHDYYIWDGWWEFMHEDFSERLKEIGIECKEFYWDFERGRYFQMNKPSIIDENLFLTSAGFQKQLILCSLEDINLSGLIINITENRECTDEISLDYDCENDEDEEKIKEVLGEDFEEKLTDYLQNVLYGFLKELEKEYEYMCSEKYVREELINIEAEFDGDGKRE